MNERIRHFMESQGLSPSELADTIGVQRSNVTHVLKGRNNPSFPFIEKLLKKYPKLNAKWLLMGEGEMLEGKPVFPSNLFDQGHENPAKTVVPEKKKEELQEEGAAVYPMVDKKREKAPVRQEEKPILGDMGTKEKTIERVMVFYSDQTFRVYNPL
ncbi:MAG: helix-turn-helix transcriptional regulator [Prolixibacteraceae bacterium]|jgi:transcriptional regulator with XRE-family HTH domain|nr:helix-turn-helix transcriptional regulator [Prolixibacteraceae bacterium]